METMEREQGYVAVVLHAHLPFVRHPENPDALEERWLFEAIHESYVPLVESFLRLVNDDVTFRMTMSFTLTLLAMLSDRLLQRRFQTYITQLIRLSDAEMARTKGDDRFYSLAAMYHRRFTEVESFMMRCDWNLISAIRSVADAGRLELITSAATHAFLPLVSREEAIRAQVETAVIEHMRHFGRRPKGIWLPECGYAPTLDPLLAEYEFDYFFVDSHGIAAADPNPVFGTYSPVLTPTGVAAFPRNPEAGKQVWSATEGYPGDFDYREFYRDVGFDLEMKDIGPFIHPDGIRVNTGIKYYRVTGRDEIKQPYRPDWAAAKAIAHAAHYADELSSQLTRVRGEMGRKPIVVAPFDAELFGHWWYEGPQFLEALLRRLDEQSAICTSSPADYLSTYQDYQVCQLSPSSWGRDGYADVWVQPKNDWIYPSLHDMEATLISLANRYRDVDVTRRRVLNQAARELLLAEASDWAFIIDHETATEYAVRRTKQHVNRFYRLCDMIHHADTLDADWLAEIEQIDNIFPAMDYQVYQSRYPIERYDHPPPAPTVLILSWEFPPVTVGGLSRHVYDLSRYLVRKGWNVHVLTTEAEGAPHEELVHGVHVHRVHVMQPDAGQFVHWAFQMNLRFMDAVDALVDSGLTFNLVHAHDWLVCYSARAIKQKYHAHLIATIHATERGRNHGIHTDLQQYIHHQEWRLTYEAERVIVCSQYMADEVQSVFHLPEGKVDVIPNGVDVEQLSVTRQPSHDGTRLTLGENRNTVLFVGRLVREKGVQTLLDAVPLILSSCPNTQFVIAGRGPMLQDLQDRARRLGIDQHVRFAGFVSDEARNGLLSGAQVTVFPSLYEPFGIVALEAMAAGAPVVVSDVGGLGEVVRHGINGLKMYPGDASSLATQVITLLRDPVYARSLAAMSTAEMGNYDWSHIVDETIRSYQCVTLA